MPSISLFYGVVVLYTGVIAVLHGWYEGWPRQYVQVYSRRRFLLSQLYTTSALSLCLLVVYGLWWAAELGHVLIAVVLRVGILLAFSVAAKRSSLALAALMWLAVGFGVFAAMCLSEGVALYGYSAVILADMYILYKHLQLRTHVALAACVSVLYGLPCLYTPVMTIGFSSVRAFVFGFAVSALLVFTPNRVAHVHSVVRLVLGVSFAISSLCVGVLVMFYVYHRLIL